MKLRLTVLALAALVVTACAQPKDPIKPEHYWQRVDTQSALHMTGPVAQQQLEQDITECVHKVVEMAKLGAIREGTPPPEEFDHMEVRTLAGQLPYWETPKYIRNLKVDHSDFHDFEGCMDYMGWERVNYVRPYVQERSRRNHFLRHNPPKDADISAWDKRYRDLATEEVQAEKERQTKQFTFN